jgi:hypothetical protein
MLCILLPCAELNRIAGRAGIEALMWHAIEIRFDGLEFTKHKYLVDNVTID